MFEILKGQTNKQTNKSYIYMYFFIFIEISFVLIFDLSGPQTCIERF